MRKILSLILAMSMLVIPVSASEVRGKLSGGILKDLIKIEGQEFGYYVSIREFAEKEGMSISYDKEKNSAIVEFLGNKAEFPRGKKYFFFNKEQVQEEDKNLPNLKRTGQHSLPTPNEIIDGKMYVSSDVFAIIYGNVNYNEKGFSSYEDFRVNKSVVLDKGISTELNDKYVIKITDFQKQKDILKRTLLFIDDDYARERYTEINAYFNEDIENYYNDLEIVNRGEYVEVIIKK